MQRIHNMLTVTFEDNSKPLDKASSRACFIAVASHSAVVTTNGNIMVCAWTKEHMLSQKHIPFMNFLFVMKIAPSTLHFSQFAEDFSQVST
jgi:hypothetical protein